MCIRAELRLRAESPNPSVPVPGWTPDLRKYENRFTVALLVKL